MGYSPWGRTESDTTEQLSIRARGWRGDMKLSVKSEALPGGGGKGVVSQQSMNQEVERGHQVLAGGDSCWVAEEEGVHEARLEGQEAGPDTQSRASQGLGL